MTGRCAIKTDMTKEEGTLLPFLYTFGQLCQNLIWTLPVWNKGHIPTIRGMARARKYKSASALNTMLTVWLWKSITMRWYTCSGKAISSQTAMMRLDSLRIKKVGGIFKVSIIPTYFCRNYFFHEDIWFGVKISLADKFLHRVALLTLQVLL